MTDLYFLTTGSPDANWSTADNWWLDSGATIPAGRVPTDGDSVFIMGTSLPTPFSVTGTLTLVNIDTSGCSGSDDNGGAWASNSGSSTFTLTGNLILGIKGGTQNHKYYNQNGPIAGNVTINGFCAFYLDNDIGGVLTLNDTSIYSGSGNIGSIIVNSGSLASQPTSIGGVVFNGGYLIATPLTSPYVLVTTGNIGGAGGFTLVGILILIGDSVYPSNSPTINGSVASDSTVPYRPGLAQLPWSPRIAGTVSYFATAGGDILGAGLL